MEQWKTVVEPKTRLLDIPLKELWQYRNMVYMLVKRNYQVEYKQTILGPTWMVLGIILSSGLFSLIFGYVGQFPSEGIPYFLFYMSAGILWDFFSRCVSNNSGIFLGNAYLFGKIYFPRMVVPVANVMFELVRFLIQFAVCIAAWLVFLVRGEAGFMGLRLLFLPGLVLESGILGMAMGMLISSLTTKYRDLSHVVGFGMQILMYAAPVLYPLSHLPEGWRNVVLLNPMASVVEAFRYCLTGSGGIHVGALVYSFCMTALVTLGSVILFNQTEKTFIDIV